MNPSLSFSLDERTVAALLQEDESTFNMLGSLLPSAASAALAAAEGQHGDSALAMQQLLQLQVLAEHLEHCLRPTALFCTAWQHYILARHPGEP